MTKKKKGAKMLKTLQDIFDVVGATLMNKQVVAVTASGEKFAIEDVENTDEGAVIKLVPVEAEQQTEED